MISGEIKRFLRDDGMIKVSRSLKEEAYKISLARENFQKKYHREATLEEISGMVQLPVDEIVVAVEANKEVESLNKTIYEGDGHDLSLMDTIEGKCSWEEDVMNHLVLSEAARGLKEEEKKILKLRYFENKTQKEVGQIIGVSQVQVSRMEKKILFSLRKKLAPVKR
jgi:RNA polymerase sporulation-specific sigma factor